MFDKMPIRNSISNSNQTPRSNSHTKDPNKIKQHRRKENLQYPNFFFFGGSLKRILAAFMKSRLSSCLFASSYLLTFESVFSLMLLLLLLLGLVVLLQNCLLWRVSLIRAKVCLARNIVFLSKTSWDSAMFGWHKFSLSPSSQPKICRAITGLGFLIFSECKGNFLLGLRDVKVSRKITEYGPGKKERKRELIKEFFFNL